MELKFRRNPTYQDLREEITPEKMFMDRRRIIAAGGVLGFGAGQIVRLQVPHHRRPGLRPADEHQVSGPVALMRPIGLHGDRVRLSVASLERCGAAVHRQVAAERGIVHVRWSDGIESILRAPVSHGAKLARATERPKVRGVAAGARRRLLSARGPVTLDSISR